MVLFLLCKNFDYNDKFCHSEFVFLRHEDMRTRIIPFSRVDSQLLSVICTLLSVIYFLSFCLKIKNIIIIAIIINIRATICQRAVVSFALVVGSGAMIVSERMWVV